MKGFSRKSFILFICMSLILNWNVVLAAGRNKNKEKKYKFRFDPLRCAAGVVAAGAPFLVAAAGFGPGGIGAGTLASWLMSWSAIANGGGVPAGGLVAYLQSLGAGGVKSFAASRVGQALIDSGCLTLILEEDDG